ncbi:MAG: hypothetical protein JSR36_08495 [Proteobacteria bacterium]|nr:hypothetical protein [Pseudomonadota bacterium]
MMKIPRRSTTRSRLTRVNAAIGAIALCGAAQAESTGLLNDTIDVSLGTFLLSTDTRVTLNGTTGDLGTDVNLGRDLGIHDANRFRVDATWRFFKRHKLRAMYFSNNQRADKSIDRDLTIGDTTYSVGANLHSSVSNKIAELAYEYAFWQGDNYEVTGSVGVHTVKFDFAVSGEGSVNGETVPVSAESATATAPLPVVGARGLWEFSPNWYFDGQVQYFALKIDNIDGHLTDLRAGVTRMFGKHFGIGAGYNQFATRVNLDRPSFEGSLRWRYSGAMIYITGSY